MGLPVVTVTSGGLPIVESTVGGTPVTEAANGYGVAVTKVIGRPGMPVVYETIGVVGGGPLVWSSAYSKGIDTSSPGWAGYNMRQVIGPAELAFSGSKVRVTLKSGTAALTVDHAAIGHAAVSGDAYDFDGGQVPLTFAGGNPGFTIGLLGSILSDEITFSLNKTKSFIVAVHISSGTTLSAAASGAAVGYFKSAADETLVSNVSTYTSGLSYLVSLIEVAS